MTSGHSRSGVKKTKMTRTPSSVSRFLPVVVSQMVAVAGGCERRAPGGDYRGRRSVRSGELLAIIFQKHSYRFPEGRTLPGVVKKRLSRPAVSLVAVLGRVFTAQGVFYAPSPVPV